MAHEASRVGTTLHWRDGFRLAKMEVLVAQIAV